MDYIVGLRDFIGSPGTDYRGIVRDYLSLASAKGGPQGFAGPQSQQIQNPHPKERTRAPVPEEVVAKVVLHHQRRRGVEVLVVCVYVCMCVCAHACMRVCVYEYMRVQCMYAHSLVFADTGTERRTRWRDQRARKQACDLLISMSRL